MTQLKKLLGKRIKELRMAKHYTQEYLAELTDLGATSISKIETGLYHPSDENLEKIANALGVEPYKLYMFGHLDTPENIRKKVAEIVKKASDKEICFIYKILNGVL